MQISLPSWLRKTGFWLTVGLAMNLGAALMSHVVVENSQDEISLLQHKQQQNNRLSQLRWQHVSDLERKRELLLSLLNQGDLDAKIANALNQQIYYYLRQPLPEISLSQLTEINAALDQQQQQDRDKVNNLYLANLELNEQEQHLRQQAATMKNIALLLQMVGLAFIMMREIGL